MVDFTSNGLVVLKFPMTEKKVNKYIATGLDLENFPTGKINIIGEWCLSVDPRVRRSDHEFVVEQLSPNFSYDEKYIKSLYERLLPSLSQTLNNFHRMNLTNHQWETVIGYWLLTMIHPLHDRWRRICSIQESNSSAELYICRRSAEFDPRMTSMNDKRIGECHEFNSFIYEKLSTNFKSINVKYIDSEKANDPKPQLGIKTRVRGEIHKAKLLALSSIILIYKRINIIKKQRYFLSSSFIPISTQIRLAKRLRSPVFLNYLNNMIFEYIKLATDQTFAIREEIKLENFFCTNEFEEFICNFLLSFAPKSILEDFSEHLSTLDELNLNFHPEITISEMIHATGPDLARIWMGMYGNDKKQLIVLQHGGAYGHYRLMWSYFFESRISAFFMSWGWAMYSNSESVKNIPALRISRIKLKLRDHASNKILVLLPPEFNYPHLFFPTQPMDANQTRSHLEFIAQFIEQFISYEYIRFYIKSQKAKNDIARLIFSKFQGINLVSNTKSSELNTFGLLISTYAGTNSVECLVSGTPTIFLWEDAYCNFADEVSHIMMALESAGVLHRNPLSASKIAKFGPEQLQDWWTSTEVQSAVETYLYYFGRLNGGSKIWTDVLLGAIRKLKFAIYG